MYDSGAPQDQVFDEQNYACINDTSPPAQPSEKQDEKPLCPVNNLYSLPVKKKSKRQDPNVGRNAAINLHEDATINPIYESGDA